MTPFPEITTETLYGWNGIIDVRAIVVSQDSDVVIPRIKDVIYAVSGVSGFLPHEITGPVRHQKLAYIRQLVMHLAYRHCSTSYPAIARELGGRNHTTIWHGVAAHRDRVNDNPKLLELQKRAEQLLGIKADVFNGEKTNE